MTTAAYIRVSSDKQDTQRQREAIERWGKVDHWFEDAEGKNPRDLAHKRAGFQKMLKGVEAGLISQIVVDRQDRFGVKDAYQWCKFIDFLREHDCELIDATGKSLSDDDDTTVLTGTLGAITSRREQKEKAHRNISGKISKAKAGEYQGGYPPYGMDVVCYNGKPKWRVVWTGHFERVKLSLDGKATEYNGKDNMPAKDPGDTLRYRPSVEKERIETVKQIFKWYTTEAISPGQIATRLNKMGVSAVFGVWNKVKITSLLKNPVHIGLPTWNKRGGSRFAEYVGGQIREVKKAKLGRRREQKDFVQPEKAEFKPLVSLKTWGKAQARLEETSQKGPRRAPNTADLWLRPFMVCGKCQKPMHAMNNAGVWPSYFCGTYNQHGKDNPTGCRCHKVRHSVLEEFVLQYLEETAPKVGEMVAALEAGTLEELVPTDHLEPLKMVFNDAACDMLTFWEMFDNRKADIQKRLKKCKTFVESYSVLYEHVLPSLEQAIVDREYELEAMLDDYRDLPDSVKERAGKRMSEKESELKILKQHIQDMRVPLSEAKTNMQERERATKAAIKTIRRDVVGRKKTEALRGIIESITCYFRYTEKKSFLEGVEITASDGSLYSTTSPGPG